MASVQELVEVLELARVDDRHLVGDSVRMGPSPVVFGGQLLAQSIVAGASVDPTKYVASIHIIFARAAEFGVPLEFEVDVMAAGRAYASSSVTISQSGKIRARSQVLLAAPEPDLIRHQADAPDVAPPIAGPPSGHGLDGWEVGIVDGVDIADPDAIGPAELDVWTRFVGAPDDPTINCALLGYASDGFLIGTAMRPHAGVGQSMAHVSISTTVNAHTLSFHEPVDASKWMLFSHEAPWSGRGRSHGRAQVFDEAGVLVASFTQENMIRAFPDGAAPAAGSRAAH